MFCLSLNVSYGWRDPSELALTSLKHSRSKLWKVLRVHGWLDKFLARSVTCFQRSQCHFGQLQVPKNQPSFLHLIITSPNFPASCQRKLSKIYHCTKSLWLAQVVWANLHWPCSTCTGISLKNMTQPKPTVSLLYRLYRSLLYLNIQWFNKESLYN